jgi:hypothetical protein
LGSEITNDVLSLGKKPISHCWKDEIGDVFILTKYMEIYLYSKTILGCYCWYKKHTSSYKWEECSIIHSYL